MPCNTGATEGELPWRRGLLAMFRHIRCVTPTKDVAIVMPKLPSIVVDEGNPTPVETAIWRSACEPELHPGRTAFANRPSAHDHEV